LESCCIDIIYVLKNTLRSNVSNLSRNDCENTKLHNICSIDINSFNVNFSSCLNGRSRSYLQIISIWCSGKIDCIVWSYGHLFVIIIWICKSSCKSMNISRLTWIHKNTYIFLYFIDSQILIYNCKLKRLSIVVFCWIYSLYFNSKVRKF